MKIIRITESDLNKVIKNILQERDFTDFKYRKPSILKRLKKSFKDFHSIENKEDRKTMDKIIDTIKNPPYEDFMSNIRIIGDEVINARIGDLSLVVDCDPEDPQIMFKGKTLDLNNIEMECKLLFNMLKHRM